MAGPMDRARSPSPSQAALAEATTPQPAANSDASPGRFPVTTPGKATGTNGGYPTFASIVSPMGKGRAGRSGGRSNRELITSLFSPNSRGRGSSQGSPPGASAMYMA